MTILDNPKHEAFCQAYIRNGGNASKSYIEAGYSVEGHAAEAAGSRLLSKVEVKGRIDELKQETEKKELITREGLIDEINKLNEQAMADGQYSVVMKGIELKGKMIAAFTEKREVSANVDVKSPLAEAIKELRNNRGK